MIGIIPNEIMFNDIIPLLQSKQKQVTCSGNEGDHPFQSQELGKNSKAT